MALVKLIKLSHFNIIQSYLQN